MHEAEGKVAAGPFARLVGQDSGVLAVQGGVVQHIRARRQGGGQRGRAPPGRDAGVVPAEQHLRHGQAFQRLGPGIMRIFQQAVGKTLFLAGLFLAHETRHQPGHGFDDGQGRRFPAVEHGFAHTHRFQRKKFQQACVQAFIAAADQGKILFQGQFARQGLAERAAARRHEQHPAGAFDGTQGPGHGLALHDHARPAAVGPVVHMAVLVSAEGARVVKAERHHAGFAGATHEGGTQRRIKKFGKERNQMKARHGRQSAAKGRGWQDALAGSGYFDRFCDGTITQIV